MPDPNLERLRGLLSKRVNDSEDFDSHFLIFSRDTLRKVVKDINQEFETNGSTDKLKIYYDDPYSFHNRKHFVQIFYQYGEAEKVPNVRMMPYSGYSRNSDPAIKFEGDHVHSKVLVSWKLPSQSDYIEKEAINMVDLDADASLKIVVDFLEKVFS